MPLQYPTTANQILDILKTGRRRDEFIILVTQSPEDYTYSLAGAGHGVLDLGRISAP